MIVHQVYTQIHEGEVKNIKVCDNYEMANFISRATYGEEASAVDCLQYPCKIGDRYHDNTFFHIGEDGGETAVEYLPTQEQQVQELIGENTGLQMAITKQYERNLLLDDAVTGTQLALTQLYESL